MKTRIFVLILMLISFSAKSQGVEEAKVGVAVLPYYWFFNKMKVDVDVKLTDRHWLEFSPSLHYGTSNFIFDYNEGRKQVGNAFGISHKIYIGNKGTEKGLFVKYGLSYEHIESEYEGQGLETFHKDGMEYQRYVNIDAKDIITKKSFNMILGYHIVAESGFFFDIGTGVEVRNSDIKYDPDIVDDSYFYDEGWIFSHNYNGIVPKFHLRLGFYIF